MQPVKHFYLSKILLFIAALLPGYTCLQAQNVAINNTGAAANASAMLDVSATNKGLLLPRMRTAAITSIANPAKGLMVMDTSRNLLMFNVGTAAAPNWQSIAFNSGWSLTGNAGTNPAVNRIGTTDDQNLVFIRNSVQSGLIDSANYNTALGFKALRNNGTGSYNLALGTAALTSNVSGRYNTAGGVEALFSNSDGWYNTAIGYQSLYSNIVGDNNNAFGFRSLYRNENGIQNIAIGSETLFRNLDGNNNIAIGRSSLESNISGYSNVAIGAQSLYKSTASNLVAIGDSALYNNTTGFSNTATGSKALFSNTGGFQNTANGAGALFSNADGNWNTATGAKSLYANTSGIENSAFGDECLGKNITGSYNSAVGSGALLNIIDGNGNTGIGGNALFFNQSGSDNTAVGREAGSFSTGSGNVFIGRLAGYSETGNNKLYINNTDAVATGTLIYGEFDNRLLTINGRLGIGTTAPHSQLQLSNSISNRKLILYEDADNDHQFNGFGISNSILRYQVPSSASSHVFYAGVSATNSNELMRITGNGEVGIGKLTGTTSDDSRLQVKQKGSQNGFGIEAASGTSHWDFYVNTVSDLVLYLNGTNKGSFSGVNGAYVNNSDRRLKKDIVPFTASLGNILQLQPYQYHYLDNDSGAPLSTGFMAQDVQKLFPEAVVETPTKNGDTRLGINYQYFTVLAIKGLQEQQTTIQQQQASINAMQERISRMEAVLEKMQQKE